MTVEVRLIEWQELAPDAAPLAGLSFADSSTRVLAEQLTRARVLEVEELRSGVRVRARSHVGRVRLGPLTINVEPKIAPTDLVELLRYAYRLPPLRRFGSVDVSGAGTLLQDLLAEQLLEETRRLIGRGLAKAYVARHESLESARGRIDLIAIAKGSNASSARLPCRHHLRVVDNQLNRILCAGVRLAGAVAGDPSLRAALRRTATALGSEIADVSLTRLAIAKAERGLNRLTSSYEPALRLIALLFESSGISLDDETSIVVPGFLFDMNRFFQALLSRLLSDGLPESQLQEEYALAGMMRYAPGRNPRARKSPRPRPDFLVTSPLHQPVLFDAKYRDLWNRELPREMLYQLAVYALSQPSPSHATILYPTTDVAATDAAIAISDPMHSGVRAHVVLRPVPLGSLVASVRAASADDLTRIARSLVFGAEASTPAACHAAAASIRPRSS
jgi:5-methylcytosine-specific restriction enzyme subunit McrC